MVVLGERGRQACQALYLEKEDVRYGIVSSSKKKGTWRVMISFSEKDVRQDAACNCLLHPKNTKGIRNNMVNNLYRIARC